MAVVVEAPVPDGEIEGGRWVEDYADDLHALSSLGLSHKARHRLTQLADAHNLLPSEMGMLLLNAYFESDRAQEQAADSEAAGRAVRDAEHRLEVVRSSP